MWMFLNCEIFRFHPQFLELDMISLFVFFSFLIKKKNKQKLRLLLHVIISNKSEDDFLSEISLA